MFKIVFLKNERNDATEYYVNLIKDVIENNGEKVEIIDNLKNIDKSDKVFTISLKAFFYTWLKNPKQFIIHWFQGIVPEEALMIFNNPIEKRIRWAYLSFFEKLVLKFSKFNFFVSNSMLEHYRKKYNFSNNNYFIMPCYNQLLNTSGFNDSKYQEPTFVYAGSLSEWQCVPKALKVFKEIQKLRSNSKFYLYTSERDKAESLIKEFELTNVIIDYVPYQELNGKIKNIKYGFLIRENVSVNNVATPTKMNGYLANGVIPIYSDCIHDFKDNLKSSYIISGSSVSDFVNKIMDFEKTKISSGAVLSDFEKFFDKYYNDNNYTKNMVLKLNEFKVI